MSADRAARAIDVSGLPTTAFGHRSLMWWGTWGIIVIEGTMFGLLVAAYFYLRARVETWPPNLPNPVLRWGTLNTVILLLSCIPNQLAKSASERFDLWATRLWLVVCLLFAAAFILVRASEFGSFFCRWDTNAYGSIVWAILGFHTTHLITDALDTGVLTVLMFVGPIEKKRFVDVAENALYWYFVVFAWIPLYLVLYFAPRLL
jgi:cytochrome c oxidase subunit I+III